MSKSSSSSSQSVKQEDKRIAATDFAQVATEGGAVSTTISVEQADVELLEAGLSELLGFGSSVNEGALDLTKLALEEVAKANLRALEAQTDSGELKGFKNLLYTTVAIGALAAGAYVYSK